MKMLISLLVCMLLLIGCTTTETETTDQMESAPQGVTLNVKAPELMKVPSRVEVKSDTDWKGKVHNKEIEVIEVIMVIRGLGLCWVIGVRRVIWVMRVIWVIRVVRVEL